MGQLSGIATRVGSAGGDTPWIGTDVIGGFADTPWRLNVAVSGLNSNPKAQTQIKKWAG